MYERTGGCPNANPYPNPYPGPYELPVELPPKDITGLKWLKKHTNAIAIMCITGTGVPGTSGNLIAYHVVEHTM